MKAGTVPMTETLSALKKGKAEVACKLSETKQTIESLERKSSLTKAEESEYDKLWFLHDFLEEELDNVDGAIMLLSRYA